MSTAAGAAESDSAAVPFVRQRISAFDGLRGLAVAMVLVGHANDCFGGDGARSTWRLLLLDHANFGVRLFFVLSGYLITTLLLEERAKTGSISLTRFYLRRTLRIAPAFYAYMGTLAVLMAIGAIRLSLPQWFWSAAYLRNYSGLWLAAHPGEETWFVGHLWTLAIEEQFYLLWPLTFLLTPRRVVPYVPLTGVILMPLVRVAIYFLEPDQRGMLNMMFHTGSDSILLGCAAALRREQMELVFNKFGDCIRQARWVFLLVPLAVSPLLAHRFGGAYTMTVGMTIDSLCAAALVLLLHDGNDLGLISWLVGVKLVQALGRVSYSLYLWQQIFLNPYQKPWTLPVGGAVAASVAAGAASYIFIEQPFLRLKSWFGGRRLSSKVKIGVPSTSEYSPPLAVVDGKLS